MLEEKLRLVITFHTTTSAMQMEKCCKSKGLPGKLIAIPDQLTAGCGFSWLAEVEDRRELEKGIEGQGIEIDGIHELVL